MMNSKLSKLIAALKVTAALGVFAIAGMSTANQVHAMTNSEITSTMDGLKSQLNGKYWNAAMEGKGEILLSVRENKPCSSKKCVSNLYKCGNVSAIQCSGFAHAYGYYLFGSDFTSWEKRSDVTQVEPGDIIHVKGHEAIVWKTSGSDVYVAECWGSQGCKIAYGYFNGRKSNRTMNDIKKNYTELRVYKHPGGSNQAVKSSEAPKLFIKSVVAPSGTHKKGKNFGLRGVISTNCGKIIEVKGYVYGADGRAVKGFASTYRPNSSTIDLRYTINNDLIFEKLAKGNYQYVVVATAQNGDKVTTTELIRTSFSVK